MSKEKTSSSNGDFLYPLLTIHLFPYTFPKVRKEDTMTFTKWLALLLLPAVMLAFFPQPYHTADVRSREISFTSSLTGNYFGIYFFDSVEGWGISPFLTFRATVPRTNNLAFVAYGGGMLNREGFGVDGMDTESANISIFPNAGLGLQWEPWEKADFSLGLSAGFPSLISLTLMKGIRSRKLDREVVTLGLKSFAYVPSMLFVAIHPTERLHFTFGLSYLGYGGEVHAGIGYTFNLAKQEKGEGNETIEE